MTINNEASELAKGVGCYSCEGLGPASFEVAYKICCDCYQDAFSYAREEFNPINDDIGMISES